MNRRSLLICVLLAVGSSTAGTSSQAIEPWEVNPWYWSHRGQPVLLIGGSDDDNLFQWPDDQMISQLDRIQSAGGNVVRNTMSDRKDRGFEVYPFGRLEDGQYDLTQWNEEYWRRFDRFLRETATRNIFVQIEIWDRFDYTDNRDSDPRRWEDHPYNPINNVNYSVEQTGLRRRYPQHPGQNQQPFFFSTPNQRNIEPLLKIQQAFVHRLLDDSLRYDHVLYCIDNETSAEPEWGRYWANVVRERAKAVGKTVAITEMWDAWNLDSPQHRNTFDHPELYDFVDVSQNNHNRGQQHWGNLQLVRKRLADQPRPINTTKTYGADGNKFGHSDQDAIERFWRHLLGGVASARFHRPDSGLGINDRAVACLRSARRVEAAVPFWNLEPALDLLQQRDDNEAYAAATENQSTVVIYFPRGETPASVQLNDSLTERSWQCTWVDVDTGSSAARKPIEPGQSIEPPTIGNFVAILRCDSQPLLNGELLTIEGNRAFVMLPDSPPTDQAQPWVMYAPTLLPDYPDEHERWMHEQWLQAGIAIAGIDVGEAYGSPTAVAAMDALYEYLVTKRNFDPQPVALGRSRGGLWVSSWAAEHPEKVAGLAGIYPVFDLRSYPGLERAAGAFGLSTEQLQARLPELNPLEKAESLASHPLPALVIHGEIDRVVPIEANSQSLAARYQRQGHGEAFRLKRIADQGHNYWPGFFRDPDLVQFVIEHAKQ